MSKNVYVHIKTGRNFISDLIYGHRRVDRWRTYSNVLENQNWFLRYITIFSSCLTEYVRNFEF